MRCRDRVWFAPIVEGLEPLTIANVYGTAREKSRCTIHDFFRRNRKRSDAGSIGPSATTGEGLLARVKAGARLDQRTAESDPERTCKPSCGRYNLLARVVDFCPAGPERIASNP